MRGVKYIIFDFDGTIVDSFYYICDIIFHEANKRGIKVSKEKVRDYVRNKSIWNIMKEFKISKLKASFIVWKERRRLLAREVENMKIFNGIGEVFKKLKEKGVGLGIISTNKKENVLGFLKRWGLDDLFDFVYKTSLFGKERVLKKVLKKRKLKAEDVLYIGDEVRDVEGARKAGVKCCAVTWGFNSEKLLRIVNPNFIVRKPGEILKILD